MCCQDCCCLDSSFHLRFCHYFVETRMTRPVILVTRLESDQTSSFCNCLNQVHPKYTFAFILNLRDREGDKLLGIKGESLRDSTLELLFSVSLFESIESSPNHHEVCHRSPLLTLCCSLWFLSLCSFSGSCSSSRCNSMGSSHPSIKIHKN